MLRLAGALLLIPLAASAESAKLYDPPRADDTPSAFACTAVTLASGEQCVFEGKPDAKAASSSAERLRALVQPACAGAVKDAAVGDRAVLEASCASRLQAAADHCGGDGALLDSGGRFTSAGRSCYRALSEARSQAQALSSAAPTCCSCLAQHHCGGAGPSCVEQAARASLAASCGSDDCTAACAELVSTAAPMAKPAAHGKHK